MKLLGKIGLAGVLVLACCLLVDSPSWGQFKTDTIFYDNFAVNSLVSWEWEPSANPNYPLPTLSETNQRLEMTIPPDSYPTDYGIGVAAGPKLDPYTTLTADFDLQVDFNLLNWTIPNGMGAGLSLIGDAGQCVIRRESYGPNSLLGQRESYFMFFEDASGGNGQYRENFTSDSSGRLRLKRTGDKIEGFYRKDNLWVSIGPPITYPGISLFSELGIGVYNNETLDPNKPFGQTVKVAFDNFLLSMVPPTAANVNILDYYFTKVGAWEKYSYVTPPGFAGFTLHWFSLHLIELTSGPYAGKYRLGEYHTPDANIATCQIFDWSADRSAINIYADSLKVYNPAIQISTINPIGTLITNPFASTQWYFKKLTSYTVPDGTFNDILVWINLDENFGPNSVNNTFGLNVPFGVSAVTWYALGRGEIAKLDVDGATGITNFNYQLYDDITQRKLRVPLMPLLFD